MSAPDRLGKVVRPTAANNTVRSRIYAAKVFLDWCQEEGYADTAALTRALTRKGGPIRSYRPTYGKVQAPFAGRWLSRDEAFPQLVGSCQDGTVVGLRDEIVLRLGLAGIRNSEIRHLTLGDLDLDAPLITWTGKGRKPRTAVPHSDLVTALRYYLATYAEHVTLMPELPLICQRPGHKGRSQLLWGVITPSKDTITKLVIRVAANAGLGHVTPHDLRRTAAGILHNATTTEGAHYFDLHDIQNVLDHEDPTVTARCYIDPMHKNDAKARAANYLG